MSKRKHYPSTPRKHIENINKNTSFINNKTQKQNTINLSPLVSFEDQGFSHQEWVNQIKDSWINSIANINNNNSIMQYSNFLLNRLSYQQLASLSTDDIIRNAIGVITRECLSKWGKIIIKTSNENIDITPIKESLEKKMREINIIKTLNKAVSDSLLFGGSFIYFNFGGHQDYEKDLIISKETNINKLLGFRVIEPWMVAPSVVNTTNPLNSDFMKPKKWYISGVKVVSATRLYPLVFFEAPDLIKPLFNFLGISLTQYMFDKVKCADTIRQSLSDIFLRFRMDIIKTPALATNNQTLLENRINAMNESKNNLATLMLTDKEDFIQSITPLSGLDKIQAQAYESIASSATIPINKLFGQTPTGLNNSGAYDLANFNDTIKGYQNNIIKPFIDKVLSFLINELEYDGITAEFEFNPLEQLNELELAQANNLKADFYIKLINAGVISQDDALDMLQSQDLINDNITPPEDNDFNLNFGLNNNEETNQENFKTDLPQF